MATAKIRAGMADCIIAVKEMQSASMNDIDPNTIKSINVLKGENAIKLYGEKGVIEIITKKN
jgi:hypothetical protein